MAAGEPQTRGKLATLFWDRSAEEQARASLRQTLSVLRKALATAGADILKVEGESIGLEPGGVEVDALEFARLMGSGSSGDLEQATALYRGDFLAGFGLREESFEEWLTAERARLHELAVQALTRLLERHAAAGAPERAIILAQRLLALDPLQEGAHRTLMRLYAGQGRGEAALKQYESCIRVLQRELGVAPAPETEALYREITAQRSRATATAVPAVGQPKPAAAEDSSPLKQQIHFCTAADGVRIAYATTGSGPALVKAANWLSHLEHDWRSPVWRHLLQELGRDYQLVRYDQRGNGLSDWDVADISFEAFVRDLESVVDAAGLDRFALLGISQGCAVSIAYALRHPQRVTHLILYGGYARGWRKRGSQSEIERGEALLTLMRQGWGQENPAFRQMFTSLFIPDGTAEQIQWFNDLQRMTTSPENAARIRRAFGEIDVRTLLPQVRVPTLVLHARHDAIAPFEQGRELGMSIPGARFVPLKSRNHLLLEHEPAWPQFLDEVRRFLREPVAQTSASAKPTLAVLPFRNISDEAGQDYFADGVTEDVITALSSIRWLTVIARNSSFTYKNQFPDIRDVANDLGVRYVLRGSVRKAGARVRITAQLLDSFTGTTVWANRYDRDLQDIFALQDELTETIVGAIEPELASAERRRARTKHPNNLDAWDLYQRGLAQLYQYTRESLIEAHRLFGRAIELDPDLSPAFSASAEAYYIGLVYGLADAPEENRVKALAAARRAVELDSNDAAAHCTLGRVHYLRREHELAIPELEIALELNPSFAWAHYGIGAALVFTGRAKEAIVHLRHAIRLSPRDPYMGSFLVRMADAHLFMHEYEQAIKWARRALRQPHFQWSRHAVLISALGYLGRAEQARQARAELLQQRPDFSLAFVRKYHLIADPADMAHYLEGLRKAGIAEG
jgi:TolB-like protein/DNA-binding SARP family transcriptional activator/pimeloyl-ACP methyl ester carboxylesterase